LPNKNGFGAQNQTWGRPLLRIQNDPIRACISDDARELPSHPAGKRERTAQSPGLPAEKTKRVVHEQNHRAIFGNKQPDIPKHRQDDQRQLHIQFPRKPIPTDPIRPSSDLQHHRIPSILHPQPTPVPKIPKKKTLAQARAFPACRSPRPKSPPQPRQTTTQSQTKSTNYQFQFSTT
jgi:hypothetical protein